VERVVVAGTGIHSMELKDALVPGLVEAPLYL